MEWSPQCITSRSRSGISPELRKLKEMKTALREFRVPDIGISFDLFSLDIVSPLGFSVNANDFLVLMYVICVDEKQLIKLQVLSQISKVYRYGS